MGGKFWGITGSTTLHTAAKRCILKEKLIDHEHGEKHVKREELVKRAMGRNGIHECLFLEYVLYKEA